MKPRAYGRSLLLALLLVGGLAACPAAEAPEPEAPVTPGDPAPTEATAAPAPEAKRGDDGTPAPRRPPVVILATAANQGEIGECGCSTTPLGGLAKRATALESAAASSQKPLRLDAGNALYRELDATKADPGADERAAFILKVMGQLGYQALAVGPHDVVGGVDALKKNAEAAGIPLLSANLVDPYGNPIFPPSLILPAGGDRRVGIIGISTADPHLEAAKAYVRAKVTATDPVQAVKSAVDNMEAVHLLMVLGPIGHDEAARIAEAVPKVRLLVVGGNGRLIDRGRPAGQALLYEAGFRGQSILKLTADLKGPGPLIDGDVAEETRDALAMTTRREAALEKRIADAKAGTPEEIARVRGAIFAERARLEGLFVAASGGEVKGEPLILHELVKPDAELAAAVAKVPDLPDLGKQLELAEDAAEEAE